MRWDQDNKKITSSKKRSIDGGIEKREASTPSTEQRVIKLLFSRKKVLISEFLMTNL